MSRKLVTGTAVSLILTLAVAVFGWHLAQHAAAQPQSDPSPAVQYVASRLRQPFHRPDCEWAAKISPKNLEVFETREQAIAAGHRPCKVCQP